MVYSEISQNGIGGYGNLVVKSKGNQFQKPGSKIFFFCTSDTFCRLQYSTLLKPRTLIVYNTCMLNNMKRGKNEIFRKDRIK